MGPIGANIDRQRVVILVCCGLAYLFAETVVSTVVVTEYLIFDTGVSVAVLLAMLFGYPAVLAVGIGAVIVDLVRMTFGLNAAIGILSVLILSALSARWKAPRDAEADPFVLDPSDWCSASAAVALAGVVAAAVLAWSQEIVGTAPFFTAFGSTFLQYLWSTLVVVPLVSVLETHPVVDMTRAELDQATGGGLPARGVVVTSLSWPILAFIGSIGFRIRERIITPVVFEERGIEWLYYLVHPDVFGQGGRRAQVVFGAAMLTAFVYLLRQSKQETSQHEPHAT